MNDKISNIIDEIVEIINNDKRINTVKDKINNIYINTELMNKINYVKNNSDNYNNKYIETKKEILNNIDYKEYKNIEQDLSYLIIEINKRLNLLKDFGDNNENN